MEINMSRSVVLLLVLVFITASCAVAVTPVQASSGGSWTSKASLHEARALLGVAVVNGKIYAIGGNNQSNGNIQCVSTNEEYDPATDTWTFKESMPTPRASFGITVYQNKIYVIGGFTGVEDAKYVLSGANEVYDPATDTWETKTSLPTPRLGMQANVVEGKIYVIGGNSSANEVYNPATDSWTTKTAIPSAPGLMWAWSCASVVVDSKIHVIGAFPRSNSHQIYDPVTDSWSFGTPVVSGCFFAAAGTTAGVNVPKRIYVYGADTKWWDLSLPEFTSQSYDAVTGNWTVCTSMPTPRINVGVAVVADLVYVIGGEALKIGSNAHAIAVNEQYTPFGYGTSDQSTPSPSPSPTPTLMPSDSEFFPTILVVVALVIVGFVGVGFTVYFKKSKH
jgi:hypothetical protein